jgi:hypothetical protein
MIEAKITEIKNDSSNATIVFTYEVYVDDKLKLTETINVHSTSKDTQEIRKQIKQRIKQRFLMKKEEQESLLKSEIQKLVGQKFSIEDEAVIR